MIYLFLSIFLHVYIFLAFRMFKLKKVHTLSAIVVNYWVCIITGLVFYMLQRPVGQQLQMSMLTGPWVYYALVLGGIFISIFYLMAITTQRLTVAVSSMASKMSLVLPVVFSLLVLKIGMDRFDGLNLSGLLLAFVAIVMTSYQGKSPAGSSPQQFSPAILLLPVGVFLGSGLIDIIINYSNTHYVTEAVKPLFPIVSFGTAALLGTGLLLYQRVGISRRNLVAGVLLGIPNYFSIFFIFMALSAFDNNGALVYPIINIGIIMVSALMGVLLFRERLTVLNWFGLLAAAAAITLISYQALIQGISA